MILSNFAAEMTKYNTYTLKNGLRVIHLPSASQVVYCGYQIAAGTRNELPGEEGLAHFCEHLTFKGTERRNALQIINALEGVGGELNAFTNKEDTDFENDRCLGLVPNDSNLSVWHGAHTGLPR